MYNFSEDTKRYPMKKEPMKSKSALKEWSVRLKVHPEEERTIKMAAIKKGMGIADYVKEIVLDHLSANQISIEGKSKVSSTET